MVVKSLGRTASPRILQRMLLCLLAATVATALALTGCASSGTSSASGSGAAASQQSATADSGSSASEGASGQNSQEAPSAAQAINVTVKVMDPDNAEVAAVETPVTLKDDVTVFAAIEATGVDMVAEDSSYGKYITSLNGKAAEGSSGWVYTVNGEEVMESADACQLSDGDTVEFTYITM